jgi:RNA polymerase-binding transcription factor DksA
MSALDRDRSAHAERLRRLEAEVLAALEQRDLARDGDERGDGHHHPAEAATDAELRERQLREQLRWRERRERLLAAQRAIEAGTYGICVDCDANRELLERLRALAGEATG